MTPGALAAAEGVQPQSLTRVLADLEESAYVLRGQDSVDRRQFQIKITCHGCEALEQDAKRRSLWLASAMTSLLSPTEEQILHLAAQLMEKLATFSPGEASRGNRNDTKEALR